MPTKIKNIEAEPFQWDFYTATNRFPTMIAGVGTGKTLWALLKGDLLSRMFKNNVGAVVRSKFTDLRDSTMKDFMELTGKHVPQGTKEVSYSNGSIIKFRHAKELSGLKNINLGWAYIEQAEEFPTESQFDMLRFRLRHDLTIDEEYWELMAKQGAVWPFMEEIRENSQNQMIVIANANGHNWCWKRFIKTPIEGSSCIQATSFDNGWLIKNKPNTIKDWRQMEVDSPVKFKQYVMNCHDEVDLDACYYISIMNSMRANQHVCHVSHDPSVRVHLSFDIGLDCTAIWFYQKVHGRKNLIDYYENTGKFVAHYTKILDEKREKGYNYGKVVLPHDAKARSKVSGESYAKAFRDLGYDVVVNKRIDTDVGINITADALPSFYIDEKNCESGIEALDHFRREYDEENRVFRETYLHDWASHPAFSLKEMCQADKAGLLGTGGGITADQIAKWDKKYRRTG